MDGRAGLVGDELEALEIDPPAFRLVDIGPGGPAEVAEHAAVAGRDLAEIGRSDQTAGAGLVLHHDGGLTLDVPRQVLREKPALDVGRAAGGGPDQESETLAFEIEFLGARIGRRERGDSIEDGDGGAEHSVPRSRWSFCQALALLRYRPGRDEDMPQPALH